MTVALPEIGKSLRRIFEARRRLCLDQRYVLNLGEEEIARWRIALAPGEAAGGSPDPVAPVSDSSTSAPLTLVLECVRRPRGMIFMANGVKVGSRHDDRPLSRSHT